jgi:GTP:adenosylcobinamide-phosphate guanylyltransferase
MPTIHSLTFYANSQAKLMATTGIGYFHDSRYAVSLENVPVTVLGYGSKCL